MNAHPVPRSDIKRQGMTPFQAELALAYRLIQNGRAAEAEKIYQKILAHDQAHPQANFALAMLVESRGLFNPAISYLQQVVRSQPNNLDAQLRLAGIFRKVGRNEEALRNLKIASRLNPKLPSVFNNMGNIFRELQRVDEAEKCLLKAIKLQPDSPEALNNLGALYSEQGRLDDALVFFRRAIACKPDYSKAHRNLATIKKHAQYDDEILAMETLYSAPGVTDFDRMQLGFGLGKAFEELAQYERAFEYWSVANRSQRILSPYDVRNGVNEIDSMRRVFDRKLLSVANGARSTQIPVFVVGMPRSGTSLTEQILASHSGIHGAGELVLLGQIARKVAPRGPEDLERLDAAEWRELGDEYLAEIATRSNGEHYVVDKLPGNFLYIGMIRMMLADALVIHCRRNPMDTGLSCFKNHFIDPGLNYTCDLEDLALYYHQYEALMTYWGTMPIGQIYESSYETLVGHPESEIARLLDFLNLPVEEACLEFHETRRMVATASMAQVREPIHQRSVELWRHFEAELQPLKNVFIRSVRV